MTDEATTGSTSETAADAPNGANGAVHEATIAPPADLVASTPAESAPTTAEGLRLRMKIWTDPRTGRRYLIPVAFMTDPKLGTMAAYVMTDEDTKVIKLSAVEWNALPFFYFKEDGPAPRATSRPVDVIR